MRPLFRPDDSTPHGIAMDGQGNVYVADLGELLEEIVRRFPCRKMVDED